jgi:plastocyanin
VFGLDSMSSNVGQPGTLFNDLGYHGPPSISAEPTGKEPTVKRTIARLLLLVLALSAIAVPAGARPDQVRGGDRQRVRIVDNRFRPRSISIPRGTRVRWVNRGNNPHTTTSNTDLWDSGTLSSGERFTRRFGRRGTFNYHCEIHPSMTATITVT